MSMRRGAGWVAIALWVASIAAAPANADEVPIDDFSQANQTGMLLIANQVNVPQTATDSGLSGVIGGVRRLTVEATALMDAMVDNVGAMVDTSIPGLCFNSTSGAIGDFKLFYDKGGMGLGADFSQFSGIRFTPVFVDPGVGTSPVSYTLTLVDAANNSESRTVQSPQSCFLDCQEHRFLFSNFTNITLRSIQSVEFMASSEQAFDAIIGPITLFGNPQHAPLLSPIMIAMLVATLGVAGLVGIMRMRAQ